MICARCQGFMRPDGSDMACLNCGAVQRTPEAKLERLPLEEQWLWSSISRTTAIKLAREGRTVQEICMTMGRRKRTVLAYLKTESYD